MRRSRGEVGAVLVCLVLLAGECAWSDPFGAVLGRFTEGAFLALILEPLIVLGEAFAYANFAGLRFLRALGTSVLSNAVSYFVGALFWFFASFLLQGSFASREARWALGLPVALVVEVPIVIGINWSVADHRRLRNWAIYANCASYLLLWAVVDAIQLTGDMVDYAGIVIALSLVVGFLAALWRREGGSVPAPEAPSDTRTGSAATPATERRLTWRCPCGEVNIRMADRCRTCDRPRVLEDDASQAD